MIDSTTPVPATMTHTSAAAGGRRVPDGDDAGAPLAEFDWSESIIGMGFHPEELGLPERWTWQANRVAPAA